MIKSILHNKLTSILSTVNLIKYKYSFQNLIYIKIKNSQLFKYTTHPTKKIDISENSLYIEKTLNTLKYID